MSVNARLQPKMRKSAAAEPNSETWFKWSNIEAIALLHRAGLAIRTSSDLSISASGSNELKHTTSETPLQLTLREAAEESEVRRSRQSARLPGLAAVRGARSAIRNHRAQSRCSLASTPCVRRARNPWH